MRDIARMPAQLAMCRIRLSQGLSPRTDKLSDRKQNFHCTDIKQLRSATSLAIRCLAVNTMVVSNALNILKKVDQRVEIPASFLPFLSQSQ
jgi:hypothetical protein